MSKPDWISSIGLIVRFRCEKGNSADRLLAALNEETNYKLMQLYIACNYATLIGFIVCLARILQY